MGYVVQRRRNHPLNFHCEIGMQASAFYFHIRDRVHECIKQRKIHNNNLKIWKALGMAWMHLFFSFPSAFYLFIALILYRYACNNEFICALLRHTVNRYRTTFCEPVINLCNYFVSRFFIFAVDLF